jgi:UDP-2,3-diacylglucosamine pyrophosphatase LpxH
MWKSIVRCNVFVISDLHLGGEPAGDGRWGFQICRPDTQVALATYIDSLPNPSEAKDCHLVIAGDIVDFLAEEEFEAFTTIPDEAVRKFRNIVRNTAPVWAALKRFVARNGALTLLLGNHDIELSLPTTRRALLDEVGQGRVRFIDDNQAFVLGPLLVEHGNRFDPWNAVPHDSLRRVRSQLSRRLTPTPPFPPLPGSRLVVDVMNPLKKDYPFIDLLKPEDAGALPIAAALGAPSLKDVWNFYRNFRRQKAVDYDESQEPIDPELIAAAPNSDDEFYRLAMDIAAGGDASQISAAGNVLAGARAAIGDTKRYLRREALYRAFRLLMSRHKDSFNVFKEDLNYMKPARRSTEAGFKVVVYGHTHLPKFIPIGDDGKRRYLNSGTWADVMRVPDEVWGADEERARQVLEGFVDDLENSRLEKWRRSVPTYAHIEIDNDAIVSAGVRFADDHREVTTDALMKRLREGV